MKKIGLKVIGLSYSQSQPGSYIVVLGQKKGNKKIPVIVKPNDAQYIAMKLESMKTSAPMTHDLITDITDMLGGNIREVVIHDLVEGQFYCQFALEDRIGEINMVSCGVGDAISLSLAYKCPLWASKDVLDSAGIVISDDGQVLSDEETNDETSGENEIVSVESLEKMLKEAIESEDYEVASQLRDKITDLRSQKS